MPIISEKWKTQFCEWTPEWLKLCFRIGYYLCIILLILFIIIAIFYAFLASQYNLDEVAKKPRSYITQYDDGTPMNSPENHKAHSIKSNDLNDLTKKALLAREDTRFYDHSGVDIKGLIRATIKNIISMSYKEGASTISMQLTKNTYNNKAESLHRKLLEIAITLRLEKRYTKDEILVHYLNRIYFGAGCHGIEKAAQTYFGVTTKDLTLGQSAMLMGIIRGPHIFSPFNPNRGLEHALEQRNQVLKRMVHLKFITQKQADNAMSSPTGILPKQLRKSHSSYALRSIKRHRQQLIHSNNILKSGLIIRTTINKRLLNRMTLDFKRLLPPDEGTNPLQVASVIIENNSGAIKAIIGGRNFLNSSYNRALDSKQELGPTFLPFLYLASYERGKIPLLNQPQLTGNQIGYDTTLKFCERFGITDMPAKEARDLYRGNIYASPLQLASAYSIFKNKGTRIESYFIKHISDTKHQEVFSHQIYKKPVANAANSTSAFNMLSHGESTIAWYSYAYKHAWVIAISDQYTAVTWLGYDKPKNITNKDALCEKIQQAMKNWITPPSLP